MVFTLFDLRDVCCDEKKLESFLRKYNIWSEQPRKCPSCGWLLPWKPVDRKGRPVYRCTTKACRKEVPLSAAGILAGSHLSPDVFLHFLYLWAHDCAGMRAEEMLGLGKMTVAELSMRCRLCVAEEQAANVLSLGGKDIEVEMDEAELGRKPKGLHGHQKCVKADVMGIYDRSSGLVVLDTYEKVKSDEYDLDRRFGPPRYEDVEGMAAEYIAEDSILFTDGAKAYEKLAKERGWAHAYVDHQEGEFSRDQRIRSKLRKVSTQYIDGVWGNFKTWYNARHGVQKDHIWSVVKEWQWRHNHRGEDLFMVLLKDIHDGFYR